MKTGEKIKKLRLDKSMTQAELAGNKITRNMLSLIESGAAVPSLGTVAYLAKRLNVPAGILVSDDDDEFFYRKLTGMENIRRAYRSGNYRICRELCDSLDPESYDGEIALIRAECLLGIAKEEFTEGNIRVSAAVFDEAVAEARKTPYNADHILSEAKVYCRYMRDIWPSVYSDSAEADVSDALAFGDGFCVYATALHLIAAGQSMGEWLKAQLDNGIYRAHAGAKLAMSRGDFASALSDMRALLNGDGSVCAPVIYDLFRDLEVCCRETGDFKGAYEYSGAKVMMLEKLLSEAEI